MIRDSELKYLESNSSHWHRLGVTTDSDAEEGRASAAPPDGPGLGSGLGEGSTAAWAARARLDATVVDSDMARPCAVPCM
jgi:hypothetical protein